MTCWSRAKNSAPPPNENGSVVSVYLYFTCSLSTADNLTYVFCVANGTTVSRFTETDRNGPKRTGTDRNGPERTETDFRGYRNGLSEYRNGLSGNRNGPERTETDRNGLS